MATKRNLHDPERDLIVETATTLRLLNSRLFGGDGQKGAIEFILEQHKELSGKLDQNMKELVVEIKTNRTDMADALAKSDAATKDKFDKVEKAHHDLEKEHEKLDKKVSWYSGGLALLSFIATAIGIKHNG